MASTNYEIRYAMGTSERFTLLNPKNATTFYYLTDTKELYFGENRLTNTQQIADILSAISTLQQDAQDSKTDINTLQENINTLNGSAELPGSIANVVAMEISKVIAGADSDFDTLKELADWAISHKGDYDQFKSDFNALATLVGELPQGAESTTIVGYINEAVTANVYSPTDINHPETCLVIPEKAYYRANITDVDYPIAVSIKKEAFSECMHLTTAKLPQVTSVEEGAFSSCINLTKVDLPLCSYVGKDSFAFCMNVTEINAPMLKVVGNGAFQNTRVTKIDLPCAEIIEDVGFGGSFDATEINIPMAVSIGQSAFQNAELVETITLSEVKSIGPLAFYDCKALKSVYVTTDNVPTCGHDIFLNTPMDTPDEVTGEFSGTIYVKGNLIKLFKASEGWSTYASRFAVIPGTEVAEITPEDILPSVTSEDEGKVLAVNNAGKWTPTEQQQSELTWEEF